MEEKKEKKDFEYIKSLNELLKSNSLTADLQVAKSAMNSVLKKINENWDGSFLGYSYNEKSLQDPSQFSLIFFTDESGAEVTT